MIVIVVVPVPVTLLEVTLIVSRTESSDDFLMVILPVSTSTALEKVSTMLAFTATSESPSEGDDDDSVGAIDSVVKSSVAESLIPP